MSYVVCRMSYVVCYLDGKDTKLTHPIERKKSIFREKVVFAIFPPGGPTPPPHYSAQGRDIQNNPDDS